MHRTKTLTIVNFADDGFRCQRPQMLAVDSAARISTNRLLKSVASRPGCKAPRSEA
jgi:hypothetical protein